MGEHGASGSPGKDSPVYQFQCVFVPQVFGIHWQLYNKQICLPAGAPGPQGFPGEAGAPGAKGARQALCCLNYLDPHLNIKRSDLAPSF